MGEGKYVIVQNDADANYVAELLNEGWEIIQSWPTGGYVHHLLIKDPNIQEKAE